MLNRLGIALHWVGTTYFVGIMWYALDSVSPNYSLGDAMLNGVAVGGLPFVGTWIFKFVLTGSSSPLPFN